LKKYMRLRWIRGGNYNNLPTNNTSLQRNSLKREKPSNYKLRDSKRPKSKWKKGRL